MRAWALLIAYVVVLVVACSMAASGDSEVKHSNRTLAAELRWTARHGGAYSHAYGAASTYTKTLARRLVVETFAPAGSYAVRKMLCIVSRESNFNPWAISRSGDYGLAQINYYAHHDSFDWRTILDGAHNLRVAWRLSSGGRNFGPWAGGSYAC